MSPDLRLEYPHRVHVLTNAGADYLRDAENAPYFLHAGEYLVAWSDLDELSARAYAAGIVVDCLVPA